MGNNNISVNDIIKATDKFNEEHIRFPIDTITCKQLKQHVSQDILKRNINSAYPVLHERALKLYEMFLAHKKRFGTKIEKIVYQDMTIPQLVDRLLKRRAAVFLGVFDFHVLLNGVEGQGRWETIGKDDSYLKLEDYISYDEIKLSALLSVSSYTHFINTGKRLNKGVYDEDRQNIQEEGIIIGLVGTRLTKPRVMEYQDCVVTKEQNHQGNGYGHTFVPTTQGMFLNFYGSPSLTYEQLKDQFNDPTKFVKGRSDDFLNIQVYKKRCALSLDTLFLEANYRAREKDTYAYVHIVGLGLGVWKRFPEQDQIYMDLVAERIESMEMDLSNIGDIHIAYINSQHCGKYKDGDTILIDNHPLGGVKVHIRNVDPHLKIPPHQNKEKLLVVSFAWDGNALPGNEFWIGQLHTSSDPAAACSTQVAELHNPHINPLVCGENLRIATQKGLVKYSDYPKMQPSAQYMFSP